MFGSLLSPALCGNMDLLCCVVCLNAVKLENPKTYIFVFCYLTLYAKLCSKLRGNVNIRFNFKLLKLLTNFNADVHNILK